jgi:hypothetical protein
MGANNGGLRTVQGTVFLRTDLAGVPTPERLADGRAVLFVLGVPTSGRPSVQGSPSPVEAP